MSGRVLRFEGSTHLEVERLLPWLVNGTLADDELALVQQHLDECVACRHEVDWLRSLQAACTEEAPPTADLARSARRLRRRLGTAQANGRRGWGRHATWLPWAIGAQAVLVLLLGIALVNSSRPPAAAYHTLGAAQTAHARLVVMFDPQLSEARMRRLLRASDARIIYGPTDAGGYVLSVPAARVKTVREALRAAPGVSLVESLGPGDER